MTRREKLEYVNELFKERYQGMRVPFEYPNEERFDELDKEALINGKTKKNYTYKDRIETNASYREKLNVGVEKDLISFLSSSGYEYSKTEVKPEQNAAHSLSKEWHYFSKKILVDNSIYNILIDVREDYNHQTYLHKVRLEEIEQTKEWQVPLSLKNDIQVGQLPLNIVNDTMAFEKTQEENVQIEKRQVSERSEEHFKVEQLPLDASDDTLEVKVNQEEISFSKDEEEFEW